MPVSLAHPSVAARQLERKPHASEIPATFPKGRSCVLCGHTLSRYNPGRECYAHAVPMTDDEAMELAGPGAGAKPLGARRAA